MQTLFSICKLSYPFYSLSSNGHIHSTCHTGHILEFILFVIPSCSLYWPYQFYPSCLSYPFYQTYWPFYLSYPISVVDLGVHPQSHVGLFKSFKTSPSLSKSVQRFKSYMLLKFSTSKTLRKFLF